MEISLSDQEQKKDYVDTLDSEEGNDLYLHNNLTFVYCAFPADPP